MNAHIVVENAANHQSVLKTASKISNSYNIQRTTIQIEMKERSEVKYISIDKL